MNGLHTFSSIPRDVDSSSPRAGGVRFCRKLRAAVLSSSSSFYWVQLSEYIQLDT